MAAPTRRRGEQSAGQLLAVIAATLTLAAIVNADAMVERAERKPLGSARDRALMIWHPVQDLAHVSQLHRLRLLGDLLVGDDEGGDLVGSVASGDDDAEVRRRPELRVPSVDEPLRLYVGGDSVVRDAGESLLRLAADDSRLSAALHYEIATGLARPDYYDWPAALANDAENLRPEVALIMFGGNDAQGIVEPDGTVQPSVDTPGWRAEYGRRVGLVMDSLYARDRLVLWLLQPPMRDDGFDRRVRVINEVVTEAARGRSWVTVVDTADVLGAGGRYADRLPGIDEDVRQDDGIHLSRAGADLLARHLLRLVSAAIDDAASEG